MLTGGMASGGSSARGDVGSPLFGAGGTPSDSDRAASGHATTQQHVRDCMATGPEPASIYWSWFGSRRHQPRSMAAEDRAQPLLRESAASSSAGAALPVAGQPEAAFLPGAEHQWRAGPGATRADRRDDAVAAAALREEEAQHGPPHTPLFPFRAAPAGTAAPGAPLKQRLAALRSRRSSSRAGSISCGGACAALQRNARAEWRAELPLVRRRWRLFAATLAMQYLHAFAGQARG